VLYTSSQLRLAAYTFSLYRLAQKPASKGCGARPQFRHTNRSIAEPRQRLPSTAHCLHRHFTSHAAFQAVLAPSGLVYNDKPSDVPRMFTGHSPRRLYMHFVLKTCGDTAAVRSTAPALQGANNTSASFPGCFHGFRSCGSHAGRAPFQQVLQQLPHLPRTPHTP